MPHEHILSKIQILIQQSRLPEAETMLKNLLAETPNDVQVLALFAEVNLRQGKLAIAKATIGNAIGLHPDTAFLYYIKSRVSLAADDYAQAEKDIAQAVALNPLEADFFALSASIQLSRKKYGEALNLADKALALDAENLFALNLRSTILTKMGRNEEAFDTIEGALREDPENAYTHANYGWGLLEKGDRKKALTHFREALRTRPDYQYAQAGMLEALKAANPAYRLFLKYAFWMGRMTAKNQWAVIIGLYFALRGLNFLAGKYEVLLPFVMPVVILLSLFAFSTWLITPLSNLFLRLNRYGRLLLGPQEKLSSTWVGIFLGAALVGAALYPVTGDYRFLYIPVFGLVMMALCGSMFAPAKYKYVLPGYAAAMAASGIAGIGLAFANNNLAETFGIAFVAGFIFYQILVNFLSIKRDNP